MYQQFVKIISYTLVASYIFLISLMPIKLYKLGLLEIFAEIFPALDLIVIYYFASNYNVKNWQLLLIGFFLDQLYIMPSGANALILILANNSLKYSRNFFILKHWHSRLFGFYLYTFMILVAKYIVISLTNNEFIFNFQVACFHYFTTITAYPVIVSLLDYPIKLANKYISYAKSQ